MDEIKKAAEGALAPLPGDEVTELCERLKYDPASEMIQMVDEIREAEAIGEISTLESIRERFKIHKEIMGYKYSPRRAVAQEFAGDQNITVQIVNYAENNKPSEKVVDVEADAKEDDAFGF